MCDGVELVSAIERISKKDSAEMLMKAGLSSYMGGKITDFIHDEEIARKINQKMQQTRFMRVIKAYAKEHGMDISKFI